MSLDQFHAPYFLWLFLILPVILWNYFRKGNQNKAAIQFSNIELVKSLPRSPLLKLRHALIFLRVISLSLLIVALARPRKGVTFQEITSNGVDIILALDVSSSMSNLDILSRQEMSKIGRMDVESFYRKRLDLKYGRLGAAKNVIREFIQKRENDRIGLVAFAGESQTQCPLTTDYGVLDELIKPLHYAYQNSKGKPVPGTVAKDGTAIGDAIMTSVSRLGKSDAKSKVLILLTDGANNAGRIDPGKAAAVAEKKDIKIYTIGFGKNRGTTLKPVAGFFSTSWQEVPIDAQQQVDEKSLTTIAELTGGQFFQASNKNQLEKIYETIDELEKTEIQTQSFTKYNELFLPWLLWGALLLFLELGLANTRLMKIP
jgi:Ca-activated chloride channel family protein